MAEARNWVAALRRFQRPAAPTAQEHCELCSQPIAADHPHLVEVEHRRLLCACPACALLFVRSDGKYRRVPRKVQRLDGFHLSDPEWARLDIPVELAFFWYPDTERRAMAMYPGPAGPVQARPDAEAWQALRIANPVLDELEPAVEALLVNRAGGAGEIYRVPIDRCYLLVGLIRRHWQGFSGGDAVRGLIRDYFAWLRGEPDTLGEWHRA